MQGPTYLQQQNPKILNLYQTIFFPGGSTLIFSWDDFDCDDKFTQFVFFPFNLIYWWIGCLHWKCHTLNQIVPVLWLTFWSIAKCYILYVFVCFLLVLKFHNHIVTNIDRRCIINMSQFYLHHRIEPTGVQPWESDLWDIIIIHRVLIRIAGLMLHILNEKSSWHGVKMSQNKLEYQDRTPWSITLEKKNEF